MKAHQYSFNGLAGCIVQRKVRRTSLLVGVYVADQAGMCDEAGKYVTVCETHGNLVNHATLYVAKYHMVDPTTWCADCNEQFPDKEK